MLQKILNDSFYEMDYFKCFIFKILDVVFSVCIPIRRGNIALYLQMYRCSFYLCWAVILCQSVYVSM